MTADTPTSRANTLSDRLASIAFDAMQPSLSTLLGQQLTNSTGSIGSLVLKQFDTPGVSGMFSRLPASTNVAKIISDHYAPSVGSLGKALSEMHRTQFESVFQKADFQNAMLGFSRAFTESVSSTDISSLLAQATSLQGILEQQPDVEDFAAEFLDDQPVLADSIEELPVLFNLSSTDRKLIIWFIGVVVAIYMTWGLEALNAISPELHTLLGDIGIGGIPAGTAAGVGTKKLLDKLPEADEEH